MYKMFKKPTVARKKQISEKQRWKNGKTKLNSQISDLTSQRFIDTHGLNIIIQNDIGTVGLKIIIKEFVIYKYSQIKVYLQVKNKIMKHVRLQEWQSKESSSYINTS